MYHTDSLAEGSRPISQRCSDKINEGKETSTPRFAVRIFRVYNTNKKRLGKATAGATMMT